MQESAPFSPEMSEEEKSKHRRSAAEAVKRLLKIERKIEEKIESELGAEYDEFTQAAKAAIQTFGFGGITQVPITDDRSNSDDLTDE